MEMTAEQKALFDALTTLQKEIVTGVLSGMKPVDAYKASSGKARTKAAITSSVGQIMALPAVQAFLDAMRTAAVTSAIMTREEAMERLSAIARTSVKDIARFRKVQIGDLDGEPLYQSVWELKGDDEITPEAAQLISEVSAGRDGLKFKTHSQLAAIKQLAEMQGWNAASKIEHSGTVQNVHYTAEDYKQAESRLSDRLDGLD